MVVVSIFGGIGNQMFQYAFGKCLANKLNLEFKYDYSYNLVRTDFNPSDIQSIFNLFSLEGQQASKKEIKQFHLLTQDSKLKKGVQFLKRYFFLKNNFRQIFEKNTKFDKTIFEFVNTNLYLSGHWQSEKYFLPIADSIRHDFKFGKIVCDGNEFWTRKIQNSNSVSIHLRGRDYVSNNVTRSQHFTCDIEYYRKAILLVKEKYNTPCFYIFSDDPDWAKSYLKEFETENFSFVTGNNWNTSPISDMYLMSLCKHNIIANSSFSWWAAWLNDNPNKIIFCPLKWFNEKEFEINDLIPMSWTKI